MLLAATKCFPFGSASQPSAAALGKLGKVRKASVPGQEVCTPCWPRDMEDAVAICLGTGTVTAPYREN